MPAGAVRNVVILGAAGRDFHNFNVCFRDNPQYRVIAFTAAQIPGIDRRSYPATMAGPAYPRGIPIFPESDLARLVQAHDVHEVVFAYSDTSHRQVMHLASRALAHGASFRLLGPKDTMLPASIPVVAVVAARTGAGKSTVSRHLVQALRAAQYRPVVVRHPMPYGRLDRGVERYDAATDYAQSDLTIEEMEEYEPHTTLGAVVYAGVDYAQVLAQAVNDADLIVWDGGNNDMPFYRPTVTVVVLDPTRPGQEDDYFPGEVNIRMADIVVVAKANAVDRQRVDASIAAARALNAHAAVVTMAFEALLDAPERVRDRTVLAVEDGPSLTHGGMPEGAGAAAARRWGARLLDPRPYAAGSIAAAYAQHPHIGPVLPALGYGAAQIEELRATIERVPCDTVVLGTPVDLRHKLRIEQPVVRVSVVARDLSQPSLADLVLERLCRA